MSHRFLPRSTGVVGQYLRRCVARDRLQFFVGAARLCQLDRSGFPQTVKNQMPEADARHVRSEPALERVVCPRPAPDVRQDRDAVPGDRRDQQGEVGVQW